MIVPWFERRHLISGYSSQPVLRLDDDLLGVDVLDRAGAPGQHDVARVDGRPVLEAGADQRRLGDQQRHGLPLHVRAHQCAVGVVVLEERDQRRRDRHDLGRVDVHVVDLRGVHLDGHAVTGAAQHRRDQLAVLVHLGVGLGDRVQLLLQGVEVLDLLGDLALGDLPVGRLYEAVLRHLGVGAERADQADVRTLGRLDRAHPAVVRRVHVAHLDRRALAGQAAGAERRQAAAVREAGQRVRLIHELGQLRGAEELLERGRHRADVDDRLRGDRVLVLGREALADDALHPVEADPEGLLDQLAHRAQTAVAEVLVLVEVVLDRVPRHGRCVGGEVLAPPRARPA